MKRFVVLAFLFPALVFAADPVKEGDWLLQRGNPLQTGFVKSALPDKLEVLWQFATKDAIEGTPAVHDGIVYIGSLDGNLYALDLASGQQKWKSDVGPIKAPPSYRDGFIYIGDAD